MAVVCSLAPPSADSSRGTPLPRLRTCTGLGKKASARFDESEMKKLRFPACSRQENAIFFTSLSPNLAEAFLPSPVVHKFLAYKRIQKLSDSFISGKIHQIVVHPCGGLIGAEE